jgi:hypothetical protein
MWRKPEGFLLYTMEEREMRFPVALLFNSSVNIQDNLERFTLLICLKI